MQSQASETFPSNNGNDPIFSYDPAFCYGNFSIDSESNPTPKQQNNRDLIPSPPLSFFQFEEPQFFLEQHHDFLLQFHHEPQNPEPQPLKTVEGSAKKSDLVPRRSRKRDRHSKINTARGLRDRRMRLSLEVAKRFFGLQDMLGFEKASMTVEWLLNKAKAEISSLAKEKRRQKKSDNNHSFSSHGSSECEEVVSSLDQEQKDEKVDKGVKKTRSVKNCRKISGFNPLAKECREKARERARERTKEKMRSRGIVNDESKQCGEERYQDLSQLGSWNPFQAGEESRAKSHSVNHSLNVIPEAIEQSYHTMEPLGTLEAMAHEDDDSLVIFGDKWSPSLIFNTGFSHDHQFAEFLSLGKPCVGGLKQSHLPIEMANLLCIS